MRPGPRPRRRARWEVPLPQVDPLVRRALEAYRLRLAARTGLRWRVQWVSKRSRHWRTCLRARGIRLFARYRVERGHWEADGIPETLRVRIAAHTGVDPQWSSRYVQPLPPEVLAQAQHAPREEAKRAR